MSDQLALVGDRRMTVQEVAEVLGYEADTIRKKAKDLFPETVQNGKLTLLSEAQVTILKQHLVPRTLALKSEVNMATTDLERKLLVAQAIQILQEDLDRAKAELDDARPKVEFFDQVASSKDAIPMREAAAALNLKGWGRNKLFAFLREQRVLDQNNVPYREFQDRGYFRVVETSWADDKGESHITFKTLVYQRGLDFIRKLIQKEAHA